MTRDEAIYELGSAREGYLLKDMINEIYDDFESRTCGNCVYYIPQKSICNNLHNEQIYQLPIRTDLMQVTKNFGCNKFKEKK